MRLKPKIIFALGFLLFAAVWLLAQTITGGGLAISCNAVTTTGACTAFALAAPGGNLPAAFTWQTITTGSPASVSITLEGSIDGTTFSTLDTSTSTSGELRSVTGKPVRQLRCNLGTFSGGVSPSMTCQFTVTNAGTGGAPAGAGSGTVTNTGGNLTLNSPVLGAGGSDTKVSTGITSNGASEVDLGLNGSASGVLGLKGSTSGTATITAPAVAGTSTNPIAMTNYLSGPATTGSPMYTSATDTTTGYGFSASGSAGVYVGSTEALRVQSGIGVVIGASQPLVWQIGTRDVGISRIVAGTLTVGNGIQGDLTGKFQAASYLTGTNCAAVGTAANPSVASCTAATAGSFSCATNASAGTCTVNTTAITANSEVFVTQRTDATTGTRLGVTCNTTVDTVQRAITAVTAATSFTINLGTIATNPECFSYFIVN